MYLRLIPERFHETFSSLSHRRRFEFIVLQVLGLLSSLSEVINLTALLAFLKFLTDPVQSLNSLGQLGIALSAWDRTTLSVSLGLVFFSVCLLSSALRVIMLYGQHKLSALIGVDLGLKVFNSILHRPYHWYLEQNSSQILTYIYQDVDQVIINIQAYLNLVNNACIVFGLGISLILISPFIMGVIGLALITFYLIIFKFTRATLFQDGLNRTKKYKQSIQTVQESFGAIRDIIIDNTASYFQEAFKSSYRSYRLSTYSINFRAQSPRYFVEGFVMIIISGIALLLTIQGPGLNQQIPLLGTVALGAYRLLQPVQQCFMSMAVIKGSSAAFSQVKQFLDNSPETKVYPVEKSFDPRNPCLPAIELKNVFFKFKQDQDWVIRDLSLTIQQGSHVALIGTTGSGKSTIADIVMGLLRPDHGIVTAFGIPVYESPAHIQAWQSQISHVPQHIYLSDASIAENIALGIPITEVDDQRMRWAAEVAQVDTFVKNLPKGYQTPVGERGIKLSGGQRQRIGIARAIYKQCQLLILDEATSALDIDTEKTVVDSIHHISKSLTIISIAHRLQTIEKCSQIFLIERGALVNR